MSCSVPSLLLGGVCCGAAPYSDVAGSGWSCSHPSRQGVLAPAKALQKGPFLGEEEEEKPERRGGALASLSLGCPRGLPLSQRSVPTAEAGCMQQAGSPARARHGAEAAELSLGQTPCAVCSPGRADPGAAERSHPHHHGPQRCPLCLQHRQHQQQCHQGECPEGLATIQAWPGGSWVWSWEQWPGWAGWCWLHRPEALAAPWMGFSPKRPRGLCVDVQPWSHLSPLHCVGGEKVALGAFYCSPILNTP